LAWQELALLSFPIPLPLLLQSNTATPVKREVQGVQIYRAFVLVYLDRSESTLREAAVLCAHIA